MKKYITFSLIVLFINACSSIVPTYVPKTNTYQFNSNDNKPHIFQVTKIFEYSVESINAQYTKIFCGNLANCDKNIQNVRSNPLFEGFNLLQQHSYSTLKKIDLFQIIYSTNNQNDQQEKVSGSIYYPKIPTQQIKGIILFFHPTFFAKSSVSSFDPKGKVNLSIANIFAKNGYIVIVPDYIGMGINKQQVHPYVLYPQINANDGLSILIASNEYLIKHKLISRKDSLPLFITGYSEGSAYALWFSRLYQEQKKFKENLNKTNFKLTLIAPISGAYDLTNVTFNYLFSNNAWYNKSDYKISNSFISSTLKPALLANAMLSFAQYDLNNHIESILNIDFYKMHCSLQFASSCNFNKLNLTLSEAYKIDANTLKINPANNLLDILIVEKIKNAALYKMHNGYIYTNFSNNLMPLINKNILKNQKLMTRLDAGDIYYWHSEIPTIFLTLKRDSVVSPINTDFAFRGMLENNSQFVNKIELDNNLIDNKLVSFLPADSIDHPTGLFYLLLIAQKQFDFYSKLNKGS